MFAQRWSWRGWTSLCLVTTICCTAALANPVTHSTGDIAIHHMQDERGTFLFRDYQINKAFESSGDKTAPPQEWEPEAKSNLDNAIPRPWSKMYREKYNQYFSPHDFYTNAAMLCNYETNGADDEKNIRTLLDHIVSRLIQYTIAYRGANFVFYSFEWSRSPEVTLQPGWVSAIANGFAIRGLATAYKCTQNESYLDLAALYVDAFRIVNRKDKQSPWISYVDDYGFLWFDEYPSDSDGPSFVLNGHVHALLGLAAFDKLRPDPDIHRMIQAGATTIRELGLLFRRKGEINRYSFSTWKKADYLPPRTVRQQMELFRLTGDPFFKSLSNAFAEDFAEAKESK